jgi:peptidoglycan biosynthesis protein MviN/MurJ (putative lipid II flippase)
MMRTRVLLTALTLLSSLTSFMAFTLLLRQLGASADVDQLFLAASVPISLAGVATGVLLYLLPPRLVQVAEAVQASITRTLGLGFATITAVSLCVVLGCALARSEHLFWILLASFACTACLTVLTTLASCVAQARGVYLQTGVAPMLNSASLLVGALLAIAWKAAWLMAVGQFVGTLLTSAWMTRALRLDWRRVSRQDLDIGWSGLRPLRPHVVAISLGTLAFTLFQPIDAALCAQLGNGALSVMSYAQRVLVAVSTLVSLGSHVIAARSSHDAMRMGGLPALRRQANRETVRIVGFGLVTWLAYLAGGRQLLALLLSASAMSALDLARLLDCLQWMLLGVGPMAAMPYLFRVFYSIGHHVSPAVFGMAVPIVYGLVAWAALARTGILSLAYAYSLAWWLALLASSFWLNRRIGVRD